MARRSCWMVQISVSLHLVQPPHNLPFHRDAGPRAMPEPISSSSEGPAFGKAQYVPPATGYLINRTSFPPLIVSHCHSSRLRQRRVCFGRQTAVQRLRWLIHYQALSGTFLAASTNHNTETVCGLCRLCLILHMHPSRHTAVARRSLYADDQCIV